MSDIPRLQAYLRTSAGQRYDTAAVPPFTLFFHLSTDFSHFNYAIPDAPVTSDVSDALARLRATFEARGRLPRFEFIEEFSPALPALLRQAGFVEEARQQLMTCTPSTYQPVPSVAGLTVLEIGPESPLADVMDFLTAQRLGFDPDSTATTDPSEAEETRTRRDGRLTLLARMNGEPVAAASATAPYDGITELVGIATSVPFRRRGIATCLTDLSLRWAFAHGVDIACLTAADRDAGRVYERVGFQPVATMLAYSAQR